MVMCYGTGGTLFVSKRDAERKNEKVKQLTDKMAAGFDGIDEGTKMLLTDMAETYCWYAVTCDDLREKVDTEGVLIEGANGGVKENPAAAALHKMAGRKHEYFSKILTARRRAESDDSDAMADFIMESFKDKD